jgi:hypothetical protein
MTLFFVGSFQTPSKNTRKKPNLRIWMSLARCNVAPRHHWLGLVVDKQTKYMVALVFHFTIHR